MRQPEAWTTTDSSPRRQVLLVIFHNKTCTVGISGLFGTSRFGCDPDQQIPAPTIGDDTQAGFHEGEQTRTRRGPTREMSKRMCDPAPTIGEDRIHRVGFDQNRCSVAQSMGSCRRGTQKPRSAALRRGLRRGCGCRLRGQRFCLGEQCRHRNVEPVAKAIKHVEAWPSSPGFQKINVSLAQTYLLAKLGLGEGVLQAIMAQRHAQIRQRRRKLGFWHGTFYRPKRSPTFSHLSYL